MEKKQTTIASSCCLFLFFTNIATFTGAEAVVEEEDLYVHRHRYQKGCDGSVKLFAFGDSYADTGNTIKSSSPAWKEPYGITFPGKPAGRFSDGLVLTDYLASFLGITSPVPYALRKSAQNKSSMVDYGMNFAYGGTGVLDTIFGGPNLTTQIDNFEQLLLQQKLNTKSEINSSIALVSVSGNDYAAYYYGNHTKDLEEVTKSVINQLVVDMKRILGLGVKKIVVTTMEPLGCLPFFTSILSYRNCSEMPNSLSMSHNKLLLQSLEEFNNHNKESEVVILDLHKAFMSALKPQQHGHQGGNSTMEMNPLEPCCIGVSSKYWCGSVDGSGAKKYNVCKNPQQSFFWDIEHPSKNGWQTVYSTLKSSLSQLC